MKMRLAPYIIPLAAGLLLALSAQAGIKTDSRRLSDPAVLHQKARALMQELDYAAALSLLRQALAAPTVAPALRARISIDLGIALVSVGEEKEARKAFASALDDDPQVALSPRAPPKATWTFEEVRRGRDKPAAVAEAPPPPSPAKATAPRTAKPTEAPPPASTPAETPPAAVSASTRPSLVGPLVLGGVAVVSLATAVGTGLMSSRAGAELRNGVHDSATVTSLLSQKQTMGMLSIATYVLGGVAAAAGLLWWLMAPNSRQGQVSLGLALGTDGAAATFGATF